ncbi:MAG: glycosyltransferase [Armatimonadia bacterium]|nr:glycosyltransferase [Armatimonadia bacterium]
MCDAVGAGVTDVTADPATDLERPPGRQDPLPEAPTATVLVPSYRRPDALAACLDGLIAGSRLPEQIVVVLRDTDEQSHEAFDAWMDEHSADHTRMIDLAEVDQPGQMAATNAGLALATGEIICFIDDDCVVEERWLERLLAHYEDPDVVGVGGRDIVHLRGEVVGEPRPEVGALTFCGRKIGNHHQPDFDEPRRVAHLKGANMSYRREVIPPFDVHLRSGVFNDTDVSLGAAADGGELVYDPLAAVHHYPKPRFDGHKRASEDLEAVYDLAHDYAYVMFKHLSGGRRMAFWLFALLVGQHWRYGLLRMLVGLPREGGLAFRRWKAAMAGLLEARRTHRRVEADGAEARQPA